MPLTYEAFIAGPSDSVWGVDAINYDSEGEVYGATFTGHFARERAEEYAAWKNAGNGIDVAARHPPYCGPRPRHCPACGGTGRVGAGDCPTCRGAGVVNAVDGTAPESPRKRPSAGELIASSLDADEVTRAEVATAVDLSIGRAVAKERERIAAAMDRLHEDDPSAWFPPKALADRIRKTNAPGR